MEPEITTEETQENIDVEMEELSIPHSEGLEPMEEETTEEHTPEIVEMSAGLKGTSGINL